MRHHTAHRDREGTDPTSPPARSVPALAEDAFPCQRPACGHPPSWHRLDDATNVSPVDPKAKFRCIGYDCEADGPPQPPCGCPDYLEHPQYAAWIQARCA